MRRATVATVAIVVALSSLAVATGCLRRTYHHCGQDIDCYDRERAGAVCEPTGSCSYFDETLTCPDQRIYGSRAEPGLAGQCVASVDGGVPDAGFDAGFDAGPGVAPECLPGVNRVQTAGDDGCVDDVCQVDPTCCSSAWTELCVQQVELVCGLPCSDAMLVGTAGPAGIFATAELAKPVTQSVWRTEASDDAEFESGDWADFDRDGVIDLALCGHQDQRIYRGEVVDGELVLAAPIVLRTPDFDGRQAAWADVDNDGDLDVAFGGLQRVFIVRNNGVEGFQAQDDAYTVTSGQFFEMAWGDLDLDGAPELVINTVTSIVVLGNDGNGNLTLQAGTFDMSDDDREIEFVEGVDVCNLDGDIWPEVAVVGGGFVAIVDNDAGVLTDVHFPRVADPEAVPPTVRAPSTNVACGDFVGDNGLELLVTGYLNQPRLYRSATGTLDGFRETVLGVLPAGVNDYTEGIDVGDVDRDGDLDAVVVSYGTKPATVRIIRNTADLLVVEPPILLDLFGQARNVQFGPVVPAKSGGAR